MAAKKHVSEPDNSVACAVLCYFVVGIIWYFVDDKMRRNRFVSFHAKQALVLLVAGIIVSVAMSIISMMLVWVQPLWAILWLVHTVVWIGFLVLWIMGIVAAATGQEK